MSLNEYKRFCEIYKVSMPHIGEHNEELGVLMDGYLKKYHVKREFFSTLEKIEGVGIVLFIWQAINTKSTGFRYQLVLVVPESKNFPMLYRNCFYTYTTMNSGLRVYGYDKKAYAPDYPYMEHFSECDPRMPYNKIFTVDFWDIDTLIKLEDSLKYCGYHGNGHSINVIDYIRLYRLYPDAEMLMRLNLQSLITEKALQEISQNKPLKKYICKYHSDIYGVAFRTVFRAFKKNPNCSPDDYAKSLAYRIKCGRKCAVEDHKMWIKIRKNTTPERLQQYFTDYKINKHDYNDYIKAADWLNLDFADTKVLFPRNFKAVHDAYTQQFNAYSLAQEAAEKEAVGKDLCIKLRQVAERFSSVNGLCDDNYIVFVASNITQFIAEGNALHHCVGRMGYDRKQAEGKSLICFIRRKISPEVPFVTLELKITGHQIAINQMYGQDNCQVPEVNGFADQILKAAKKQFSEYKQTA